MAVSTDLNKHIYVGNGTNKTWSVGFRLLQAEDLKLYLTNTTTNVITQITTNYSISPTGNTYPCDTATVTYPVSGEAISSTYKLTLVRQVDVTQTTVYPTNGLLRPKVVEKDFDKSTMIDQQLYETLDRCMKWDISTITPTTSIDEFYNNLTNNVTAAATSAIDSAKSAYNAKISEINAASYDAGTIQKALLDSTGYGVISGYKVEAQTIPNMTVQIGNEPNVPNVIHMSLTGKPITNSPVTAQVINAADTTNPRIDLIYISSTGVLSYLPGTPAINPTVPIVPAGGLELASIYVGTGVTSITSDNITDLRYKKPTQIQALGYMNAMYPPLTVGIKSGGVIDNTEILQNIVNINSRYGYLIIPPGRYKLTGRITIDKPMSILCLGIFELYGDAGIDYKITDTTTESIYSVANDMAVEGLKFLYKDDFSGSTSRIPITFDTVAYNLKIDRLTVSSRSTVNGVETLYGRSYAGLKLKKCFNVSVTNSVIDRSYYACLLDSGGGNYGNITFDNNFFVNCFHGIANVKNVGLQDSIQVRNTTINHYGVDSTYNIGHVIDSITVTANAGDNTIAVSNSALFSGISTPFAVFFDNGASAIVSSVTGNTLNLLTPVTYAATTSNKIIAGSVSVLTNGQWRNFSLVDGNHFEEATYAIAVCGWGSSGRISGNLFSKHVNPVYLLQCENTEIGINAYEKRTGDYYYVRLGDTTFFREVIIYAPTKSFSLPADTADAAYLYVKDNPGMTFTPQTVYNSAYTNVKLGAARYPAVVVDNGNALEFNVVGTLQKIFRVTYDTARYFYYDLPNNSFVGSIYSRYLTEGGSTKKAVIERGYSAAPISGTWRQGDIIYNDAPSAGGYAGWVCTVAGTPGVWKGFGTIQA